MRAIFISYRRQDAEGQAGRLFDDLKTQFGEDAVFMDVAGIEAGRDFRRAIDEHVASCGVLLAVIGKSWLDARDEEDRRRLDDPMDFVRLETASALQRDIPVIPVLVQGARMPRAEQLPQDLADFAYRNAVELTHARWDSDVEVLVKALRPHVKPSSADGHRVPVDRSDSGSQPVQALPSPGSSDEAGMATRAAAQPRKRSLSIALGALATAIALTSGGFVLYQKSTQGAQLARKAEILEEARRAAASELVAARKQAEEKAAEGLEARKRAKERAEAEENAAARKRAQEAAAAEEGGEGSTRGGVPRRRQRRRSSTRVHAPERRRRPRSSNPADARRSGRWSRNAKAGDAPRSRQRRRIAPAGRPTTSRHPTAASWSFRSCRTAIRRAPPTMGRAACGESPTSRSISRGSNPWSAARRIALCGGPRATRIPATGAAWPSGWRSRARRGPAASAGRAPGVAWLSRPAESSAVSRREAPKDLKAPGSPISRPLRGRGRLS